MTAAMKRILQDLCGYRSARGAIYHPPKAFSLIVNEPDANAARALQRIGVVRMEGDKRAVLVSWKP